jgi:hypothetical protein
MVQLSVALYFKAIHFVWIIWKHYPRYFLFRISCNLITITFPSFTFKQVGQVKDITTKTGRQTQRCELTLMDEGLSSFPFIMWVFILIY